MNLLENKEVKHPNLTYPDKASTEDAIEAQLLISLLHSGKIKIQQSGNCDKLLDVFLK
ncbi:hypothetical protein [Chromobacterium amazonense]|uniref:hypothetical protein n=1 Tax=Chromobacterium amazonense TaxID=1382803 RepID=UPI0016715C00|nr:hypothetical protein [Chromobacterium amazonense]